MTCCLNSACHNPPNPDRTMFCSNCGVGLVVLRNRYHLYLVQDFIDGQNLLAELQQQAIFNEQKI